MVSARGERTFGGARKVLRVSCWLGTATSMALSLSPAIAQTSQPVVQPSNAAPVAQTGIRAFNIPPQPLANALTAFGRQSGMQVTFDSATPQGLQSRGASGTFSSEEGLRRILAGTGVSYRLLDAKTVALMRPSAEGSGTIALPPVRVEGQQGDATASSPVRGYVATRATSGTKTDTPLIETPQSVSVVTRDQMDQQGAQTVPQALRYTAGIQPEVRGINTDGLEYIYGRGFILDEYLDGLRLPSNTTAAYNVPSLDPYFLQRIEVLRGPASVLYGQASPGGLVNLVSKLPTDVPTHELQFQTGSYGRVQGAFDLSGPIDKDGQFLYRLMGTGLTTGTQVDGVKQQRLAIAPEFTWRPDADTSLTVTTNYQHDPNAGFYNFYPAVGTVLPNPHGSIPTNLDPGDPNFDKHVRTDYSLGYQFEHRFNDIWTIRQNFRYMHVDDNLQNIFSNGLQANQTTINRYSFVNREKYDYFTVDNQAQAKFGTGPLQHTLLFGVDYQHTYFDERYAQGTAPALNLFNPVYGQAIAVPAIQGIIKETQNQTGLYVQDQMKLGKWAFLLGGREDFYDMNIPANLGQTAASASANHFTGRAGLVYLFDNGLAPYVSYTTSFQPNTQTAFGGAPLPPTTAEQEEVGVKYQPPGFNSFVRVSGFNLVEQNVALADPAHTGFYTSTGEVTSQGIEIEGKASLADGLSITGAYSYLSNVNTKSTTAQNKTPVGIPRNTASVWGEYDFPEGRFKGLGFGTGVRYVGFTYGTATDTFKVPDYTLVDLGAHYDLDALGHNFQGARLAVNVSNLFDKTYVPYCSSQTNCIYGLRRTVLATLNYRW